MTKKEFDAMKYMYTAPDDETPDLDTVSDDVENGVEENNEDECHDADVFEEEFVPDNVSEVEDFEETVDEALSEMPDSNETEMNVGNEKDPFYNSEKTYADGCALLIF